MNGIEKLKKIIEVQISNINNTINKYNLLSSLESYAIKLDEENLWDLTEEEAKYIINKLKNISKLTSTEEKFLLDFVKLPPEVKKVKKTYVGLDEKQLSIFKGIKNKISSHKEDNLKKDIDRLNSILADYKNLLSKLSEQNNMFLITETNIISELLTQEKISLEEQMQIFLDVNKLNEKIFANYGLKDSYEEEDIDEDSLGITNLSEEKLDELFKNYGIVWESVSLLNSESKIDKITKAKLYWKAKLLKYGDYDKISELLEFLSDKRLTHIFEMPEILVKVLLYSSVSKITEAINTAEENSLNYLKIFRDSPTLMYPSIKERRSIKLLPGGGHGPRKEGTTTSGSLNKFINNSKFLKDNGIPVDVVYSNCKDFFTFSTKTIEEVYSELMLYGFSFRYPNGEVRNGFSCLTSSDVMDKLDIAIEAGCVYYYQDNLSKLLDNTLNLYKVKFARSNNFIGSNIFRTYRQNNGYTSTALIGAFKENREYGISSDDTFSKYGAVDVSKELDENKYMLYSSVINNSDSNRITELALNDFLITQLDDKYKDQNNDLIYNFDGVIISRIKVLRLYQALISNSSIEYDKDLLVYVITRNSMLNIEEMEKIRECLKTIKFKGRS